MLKSFKHKRLSQIHPFIIEKHKQRRIKEKAPIASNRELTCLKAIFNRCIDWGKFDGVNPVRRVRLLRETPRERHPRP